MEPLQNGTLFHEYLTITGIKDETGQYSHFAGIFTDITQRKIAEERLHFLANHDPLTGLPNRTLFMERLLLATQRAQREGRKIGLMFIDLTASSTSTTPWATPQATSC